MKCSYELKLEPYGFSVTSVLQDAQNNVCLKNIYRCISFFISNNFNSELKCLQRRYSFHFYHMLSDTERNLDLLSLVLLHPPVTMCVSSSNCYGVSGTQVSLYFVQPCRDVMFRYSPRPTGRSRGHFTKLLFYILANRHTQKYTQISLLLQYCSFVNKSVI
jgi:hypothetical protein